MKIWVKKLVDSIGYYLNYRQRFTAVPGFNDFYVKENRTLGLDRARVLLTLAIPLYLSIGIMDKIVYPDFVPLFFSLRLAFCGAALAALAVSGTPWGKRNPFALIFICGLFGELAVSYMISQVEGWTSLYFVGNILTTLAIVMFIPWRPRVTALYCLFSLAGYLLINSLFHPFSPQVTIPITFLMTNAILSFFSTMGSEMNRMTQLATRLDIEKANEELKRLDEAKARFFANMSHELRTPLTLIISPLKTLAQHVDSSGQDLIKAMTSNARRLLRQVNALLDLSKIDSQEMKCHLEGSNIGDVVADLYQATLPGANDRGIQLEYHRAESLPDSLFDPEKIETVIANLISNAVKFTPAGGTITLSCAFKDNKVIIVEVQDTGQGIPKDQQERIFERFQQVDDSTKRASKGTGLGLALAKNFVELHGGRLFVESTEGQGSKFTVEIPFLPLTESLARTQDTATTQLRNDARSTLLVDFSTNEGSEVVDTGLVERNRELMAKRKRGCPVLLYVDDNRDLRQYVESLLKETYTVLLAQDGQQGFEEALKYHPELILSDLMMPKVDGFELCRNVRNDPKLKDTPFVLLTANSSLDARIEGLEDGADDYLSKPFSDRELHARIKNLIRIREQGRTIQKQIEAARSIQQNLLPPLNQCLNGVSVEAIYQPSEQLSGDFFDTIVRGDWVYVYLADVTGHGLPAAQITYLIKEIFRNNLKEEMELVELFEIVRKMYVEHRLDYDFGLQILRINSRTFTMEYVRSNAPSPMSVMEQSKVHVLDTPVSPLISSLVDAASDDDVFVYRSTFNRAASLYLFSDGAYEFSRKSGSQFGTRRLSKALVQTESEQWSDQLLQHLRSENRDSNFPDDLTVVRIRLDGSILRQVV